MKQMTPRAKQFLNLFLVLGYVVASFWAFQWAYINLVDDGYGFVYGLSVCVHYVGIMAVMAVVVEGEKSTQ